MLRKSRFETKAIVSKKNKVIVAQTSSPYRLENSDHALVDFIVVREVDSKTIFSLIAVCINDFTSTDKSNSSIIKSVVNETLLTDDYMKHMNSSVDGISEFEVVSSNYIKFDKMYDLIVEHVSNFQLNDPYRRELEHMKSMINMLEMLAHAYNFENTFIKNKSYLISLFSTIDVKDIDFGNIDESVFDDFMKKVDEISKTYNEVRNGSIKK